MAYATTLVARHSFSKLNGNSFSTSVNIVFFLLFFLAVSCQAGLQEDMDDFSSFLKKETGGGALDTESDDETPKDPKDPNRWW